MLTGTVPFDRYPGLSPVWPECFTVCTVTRLIARKRVDHLIRAFARLAAERPDARLVIVGDGAEGPAGGNGSLRDGVGSERRDVGKGDSVRRRAVVHQ